MTSGSAGAPRAMSPPAPPAGTSPTTPGVAERLGVAVALGDGVGLAPGTGVGSGGGAFGSAVTTAVGAEYPRVDTPSGPYATAQTRRREPTSEVVGRTARPVPGTSTHPPPEASQRCQPKR